MMEYQKAVAVLKNLAEKRELGPEEKEAIVMAIGMLNWRALTESKIEEKGERRRTSAEW